MHKPFSSALKLSLILLLGLSFGCLAVWADQNYDAGLKCFKSKKFADAARYFEQTIKDSPWESNAFYYCGLSYHYTHDFKKAAEKYADCVERFPGSEAGTNSQAALNSIDPNFMQRRKALALAAAAKKKNESGTTSKDTTTAASAEDKGSIEGQEQTRLFFRSKDKDKVVDVTVNGRSTRAIFDANGDSTSFSRQQLGSMGINPEKGATELRVDISLGGVVRKRFPISVDETGLPARVGNSFLNAFTVSINETAKTIDLKRKSASSSGSAAEVAFSREGKSIVVNVEINGHGTQMIFDPDASGDVIFTTQQARSIGLRLDDAETEHKNPSELPIRGEPGWISPDERAAPAKLMSVRMKFGPIQRPAVSCKILEQGPKKPTFGPDFVSAGGYKYELDYKASKMTFLRK